jgi:hypothetical protein
MPSLRAAKRTSASDSLGGRNIDEAQPLVWMGRAAGDVYAPTPEFDEEQHIQSLKPDRVDGEEIDRQ